VVGLLLAPTSALWVFSGWALRSKRALEQADIKQICKRETDVMKGVDVLEGCDGEWTPHLVTLINISRPDS
jgi:hypothetical protein